MELQTKYHGKINYEAADIINFNKGIPGFEGLKKFILFNIEENEAFSILHSIEDETIGLVVTSPFLFKKDYEFKLNDNVVSRLEIENEQEVLVYNIVTLNSDINKITINLKAPVIINNRLNLGEQIIVDDDRFSIKEKLFKED